MPNDPVLGRLTKTYLDNKYVHTAMIRHKGTVIAFAMNDQRRIFYAVQDMSPAAEGSAPKSPLDVDNWPAGATELRFPREIAEVGFGVADQTQLPLYKKGSRTPEAPGKRLTDKDTDFFLSTTARFTANFRSR